MLTNQSGKQNEDLLELAAQYRQTLRHAVYMIRRLDESSSYSAAQLGVLTMVLNEDLRVSTIAANLGVRVPSATESIKKLEAEGLLKRTTDPQDSRAVLVGITPTGAEAARAGNLRRDQEVAELLGELAPEERQKIRDALPVINTLEYNRAPARKS